MSELAAVKKMNIQDWEQKIRAELQHSFQRAESYVAEEAERVLLFAPCNGDDTI